MTVQEQPLEKRFQGLLRAAMVLKQVAPPADAEPWVISQKLGEDTSNLINAILAAALKHGAAAVLFKPYGPAEVEARNLAVKYYREGGLEAALVQVAPGSYRKLLAKLRVLAGLKPNETNVSGAFPAKTKDETLRVDVHIVRGEEYGEEDAVLFLKKTS